MVGSSAWAIQAFKADIDLLPTILLLGQFSRCPASLVRLIVGFGRVIPRAGQNEVATKCPVLSQWNTS